MRNSTKRKYLEIINARNKVYKELARLSINGKSVPIHFSVLDIIFLINEMLDFEVSRIMYYRAIRLERMLLKDGSYLNAGENNTRK